MDWTLCGYIPVNNYWQADIGNVPSHTVITLAVGLYGLPMIPVSHSDVRRFFDLFHNRVGVGLSHAG